MTGDPEPESDETDPEALADGINLGLDLSPEEQAAAEEMVAHLEAQFKSEAPEEEPEPVEPEPDPTEPEPEPEPAPEAATPEPPHSRGAVVIDGVEVPVEEAVAYLAKREAQRIAAEQAVVPEPPKPAEPPEWVDRDDPAQMGMWKELQRVEAQNAALLENQKAFAQEQTRSKAMVQVDTALSTFRQLHPELSESDVHTIRVHAAALEIIPALERTRSGSDAVLKALDIAYWDLPEFRAQATAQPSPAAEKKAARAEKKEKLNALGGSSGSVPRQEARPDLSTDRAARTAAAAWLSEQGIL
jgi:hypothetical protein